MKHRHGHAWGRWAWFWLWLGCTLAAGCDSGQVSGVRIAIRWEERTAGQRSAQSLGGAHAAAPLALENSFADVVRVVLDVRDNVTGQAQFVNFALTRDSSGAWTGILPALPAGVPLAFVVRAYDASNVELFSGVTIQSLTQNLQRVIISLAPADNDSTVDVPVISGITVPAEVASGASASVTVSINAAAGSRITFQAESALNGGDLFPASGMLTLTSVSGAFVLQYQAPVLTADTSFTHAIQITDERGTSVRRSFTVRVLRTGVTATGSGEFTVRFRPVIEGLVAERVPGSSDVRLAALVSDDGSAFDLTYDWRFLPDASTTPAPLVDSQALHTAVLRNYDTTVSGLLRLSVTDVDGGTTTLNYRIVPGQFPDGPATSPTASGVAGIAAGGQHSCALLEGGGVRCWGRNSYGQLGYGHVFNIGDNELPFVAGDVPLGDTVRQIATGSDHTCALHGDGQVSCWGRNDFGQLGYGTTMHVGDTELVVGLGQVNLDGRALRLAAGGSHTCALMSTGGVRCWGRNSYGQLGYGHTQNIGDDELPFVAGEVPLGNTAADPVQDIVAGLEHTCIRLSSGAVRCWGRNDVGQLGYGHTSSIGDNELPSVNLQLPGPARQLTAGQHHTCALLDNGRVRCWGHNFYGQLGFPSGTGHWGDNASETPTSAPDLSLSNLVALQVVAGGLHTCALLTTGEVRCWGRNDSGQLGYGHTNQTSSNNATTPMTAVNLGGTSAIGLAAGGQHTCAQLATGRVWCWGSGGYGQLGYGNTSNIGDNELPTAAGPVPIVN